MPSRYLECLRTLHTHYRSLHQMAGHSNWDELSTEGTRGMALLQELQRTEATLLPAERSEARQLLAEILANDQQIRFTASAWLADTAPLLRALNRQP
ncbi:MAG TPA: flagellar protein FliT [Azonexus sp.]|nr:flagellar protein FliT [Azonexus sp.]